MVPANFSFDFQGQGQVKGHGFRTYGTNNNVMSLIVIL